VIQKLVLGGMLLILAVLLDHLPRTGDRAEDRWSSATADWMAEIEKIFIRSEDCKQCHDRHYEEWKGMREQTPDLKSFGRVDAALAAWDLIRIAGVPDGVGSVDADQPDDAGASAVPVLSCARP
jgi:hypothetical protein